MTVRSQAFVLAIVFSLIVTARAFAHHSFAAEYDSNKPVTLRGTITKVDWINPHAWIHLEAKDSDGNVAEWMVELGTPNVLIRRGFTKKSLEPGAEITVQGYMAKNGQNKVNGGSVTFPDGLKLFGGGSGPGEGPQPQR